MNFTSDGYTEPMTPRPAGLAIGVLVLVGGVAAVLVGWMCLGAMLVVFGALTALNETGTQRIRVTRSKLLIEEESRVRGLLIGPRRTRVTWDETAEVVRETDHVRLVANDGSVIVLAKGGDANELDKLKLRIDESRAD